jgi:hypothetical protein
MLFIYLIFETAKLSREKIRQQFAIDSAAFIQMGDYTNILNRTAYVNGAFPYRIFKEAYECTQGCSTGNEPNCLKKTDESGTICAYKMLYDAGVIPKYTGDVEFQEAVPLDNESKWDIRFNDTLRPGINKNPPQIDSTLMLITSEQGIKIYIFWDPAVGIYKFYTNVYYLLGTVEESQKTVFERLIENHNFFRKSYYLNANTDECRSSPALCAEEGASAFRKFTVQMHYIKDIIFHAKVPQSGLPPYFLGKTNPPLTINDPGLFQLATFTDGDMKDIGNGYSISQSWDAPSNYFNVDFNAGGRPVVHALITSQCTLLGSGNNCVWPNPTPKYQTRLYP